MSSATVSPQSDTSIGLDDSIIEQKSKNSLVKPRRRDGVRFRNFSGRAVIRALGALYVRTMRLNTPRATGTTEPTMRWMVDDVAKRCREVLDELSQAPQRYHLGAAAMALRGAADDLVSLVELIEGQPRTAELVTSDATPFAVAFAATLDATGR